MTINTISSCCNWFSQKVYRTLCDWTLMKRVKLKGWFCKCITCLPYIRRLIVIAQWNFCSTTVLAVTVGWIQSQCRTNVEDLAISKVLTTRTALFSLKFLGLLPVLLQVKTIHNLVVIKHLQLQNIYRIGFSSGWYFT